VSGDCEAAAVQGISLTGEQNLPEEGNFPSASGAGRILSGFLSSFLRRKNLCRRCPLMNTDADGARFKKNQE
jgi:hypothetical protein